MKNKILWTLAAAGFGLAAAAQTAQAAGDPDAGKAKFHTCVGCHGIPGYSNTFPTYRVPLIGGQHAAFVVSALKAYASGARKHGSMGGNAGSMSEQDMQDIAAYVSTYKGTAPDVPVTGSPLAVKRDQKETCGACHGLNGDSSDANTPRIAGQYEDYLVKALQDYKSGARKNPIMQGVAQDLSEQDMKNLAAHFASQKKILTTVDD